MKQSAEKLKAILGEALLRKRPTSHAETPQCEFPRHDASSCDDGLWEQPERYQVHRFSANTQAVATLSLTRNLTFPSGQGSRMEAEFKDRDVCISRSMPAWAPARNGKGDE